jgi:L-threonylcarbamoyladenylate synthase
MDRVEQAAAVIGKGGLIVYPTDTLWGLGAGLDHHDAIERVFAVKRRPREQPLSLAFASVDEISEYAVVTASARRLFPLLPGPLTLVLRKRENVPDLVTGGHATVGVRVPGHTECLRLLERTGPLTSTSANLHGGAEPRTLGEARDVLGAGVDFYLEAGSAPVGRPSTIVDATVDPVRIVRQGILRESRIRELAVD